MSMDQFHVYSECKKLGQWFALLPQEQREREIRARLPQAPDWAVKEGLTEYRLVQERDG